MTIAFIDGFEGWHQSSAASSTMGGWHNAIGYTGGYWSARNGSAGAALVAGRYGYGQALHQLTSASFSRILRNTPSTITDRGVVGCDVYLSYTTPGTPGGKNFTIGFRSTGDARRFGLEWDYDNSRWSISGNDMVELANGTPSKNPVGTWVFVEVQVIIHATAGRIKVWQEDNDGNMELVIDWTGNTTSTGPLTGTIGAVSVQSSAGNEETVAYDNFYYAHDQDPIGVPVRVLTLPPTIDVVASNMGPTTGSNMYAIVGSLPTQTAQAVQNLAGGAGSFRVGGAVLPYNPAGIYHARALVNGHDNGDGDVSVFANLRVSSDNESSVELWQSASGARYYTAAVGFDTNPDTSQPWTRQEIEGDVSWGTRNTAGTGSDQHAVKGAWLLVLASVAEAAVAGGRISGLHEIESGIIGGGSLEGLHPIDQGILA